MSNNNDQTLNVSDSSTEGVISNSDAVDATEVSSTSSQTTDANQTADPSTTEGAAPKTLAEVIARAANAHSTSEEEATEESPDPETAENGSAPDDDQASKDEAGKVEGEQPKQADVPFHKHPRWQEQVAKVKELSQTVETLKPKAEIVQELVEATGGEEGFESLRQLAHSYAYDPANAVPLLEKLLEDARGRGGLVLQSEDLKQRVADGLLDEQEAIEVEQARMQKKTQAQQSQMQQQQAVEANQRQMVKALNDVEQDYASRNPDYAAMADQVKERLAFICTQQMPNNSAEAVQMFKQACEDVRGRLKKFAPAKQPIKGLRPTGSSVGAVPKPKSLREVVELSAAGRM